MGLHQRGPFGDALPPLCPSPPPPGGRGPDKDVAVFECNICLDLASHPVITLCGHLYCWPCLYRCEGLRGWGRAHPRAPSWLALPRAFRSFPTCPVCKTPVEESKVRAAGLIRQGVVPDDRFAFAGHPPLRPRHRQVHGARHRHLHADGDAGAQPAWPDAPTVGEPPLRPGRPHPGGALTPPSRCTPAATPTLPTRAPRARCSRCTQVRPAATPRLPCAQPAAPRFSSLRHTLPPLARPGPVPPSHPHRPQRTTRARWCRSRCRPSSSSRPSCRA